MTYLGRATFLDRILSGDHIYGSKFHFDPDFGGRIWRRSRFLGSFLKKNPYILTFIFWKILILGINL